VRKQLGTVPPMSDATATLTRTVDGEVLPAPGIFALDPVHSHIGFSVRHMMIAKVRGRFTAFNGTLSVGTEAEESTVEVEVDLDSIDTKDTERDAHLRSPDFFDVARFPTMRFDSRRVLSIDGDGFRLDGNLTLHGVTRPLALDVVFDGVATDPYGGQRLGFSATGEIDREAFGLTWNQTLETGGVLVGRRVRIDIEAELVRQQPPTLTIVPSVEPSVVPGEA
jgi:polyisoprenoid-binding protein YceI